MEDAVAPARWEGAGTLEILTGYIEFSLTQGRERAALHRAALTMASRDASFALRHNQLAAELHAAIGLKGRSHLFDGEGHTFLHSSSRPGH